MQTFAIGDRVRVLPSRGVAAALFGKVGTVVVPRTQLAAWATLVTVDFGDGVQWTFLNSEVEKA